MKVSTVWKSSRACYYTFAAVTPTFFAIRSSIRTLLFLAALEWL